MIVNPFHHTIKLRKGLNNSVVGPGLKQIASSRLVQKIKVLRFFLFFFEKKVRRFYESNG